MVSKVNTGQVKFSSWGRTRSPKNILSEHRAGVDAIGTPQSVKHNAPVESSTENQRFLIVVLDSKANTDTGDPAGLTVFGLSYAAATFNANGTVNAYKEIPLVKDIHGAAVSLTTAGNVAIIPIVGIDKIRFKVDGSNHANDECKFYAACSTF